MGQTGAGRSLSYTAGLITLHKAWQARVLPWTPVLEENPGAETPGSQQALIRACQALPALPQCLCSVGFAFLLPMQTNPTHSSSGSAAGRQPPRASLLRARSQHIPHGSATPAGRRLPWGLSSIRGPLFPQRLPQWPTAVPGAPKAKRMQRVPAETKAGAGNKGREQEAGYRGQGQASNPLTPL